MNFYHCTKYEFQLFLHKPLTNTLAQQQNLLNHFKNQSKSTKITAISFFVVLGTIRLGKIRFSAIVGGIYDKVYLKSVQVFDRQQ
jgi:hypothetical protein